MRGRAVSIAAWAVLSLLAVIVAARAHYTADLSAFLPSAPSHAQRLLVEQLRDGLASRLILVDIEGADLPTRARLSRALAARLRGAADFRSVMNGEATGLEPDREFIFAHRYALSERVTAGRFAGDGLKSAVADSLDALASPTGLLARDLFVRDPTGETLQILSQLDLADSQPRAVDGIWVSGDERRALLVAQTRAAGSDSDAQQRAIETIRSAFAAIQRDPRAGAAAPAVLQVTGPGVFAAEARTTIQREAVRLSLLSSALIAAFLLVVYRSLRALLYGLLPVASGALAGVAAVALGFGVVHGVTLGFGVTLIGEAVDYSVYLFIQARHGPTGSGGQPTWTATLWPTIRLGMLTSICGFGSLLPSAFPGLAQLGLYSIAGLVAAGLVTRFVLPQLLPRDLAVTAAVPLGRAIARALAPIRTVRVLLWLLPVVAGIALVANRGRLWNHDLSALSPVPAALQSLDGELRTDLGAPDVRTLIVLTGKEPETVLQAAEALRAPLDSLVARGVLAGYRSPARFLPSAATQALRRASLPPRAALAVSLESAVTGLPVHADRLRPFLDDVEVARSARVIHRADLEGTSFAAGVDALLVRHGDSWNVLLPLMAPRAGPDASTIDAGLVRQALRPTRTPGVEATVLDLKQESNALYAGYLSEALRLSAAGFTAIIVLLLASLRSVAGVARVVGPLLLAVLVVMGGFALAGHALTILHLIGLLLVVAIGSNYALFFERESPDADPDAAARVLASLLIANTTTVIAFGVLALSTVPVLAALGSTVAPGTLLALVFSAAFTRDRPMPRGDG